MGKAKLLTFEEAEKYLNTLGLDIQKPTETDTSDPAWVESFWFNDVGKLILYDSEDGYFMPLPGVEK